MEYKKVYTAVTIGLGAVFFYSLFNLFLNLFKGFGFQFTYFLYFIPVLVGITGLLIFVTSGYKKSGLLRMYMCYQVFSCPFMIFYYYNFFFNRPVDFMNAPISISWQFYAGIFLNIIAVAAGVIGLWYIGKRRLPKITYFGQGENKVGQFVPANGSLRFANRIIDGLLIIYTAFWSVSSYFSFRSSSFYRHDDITDSPALLYIIEIPALIIYYLLLEGIFNTTAGKCATNTTIVNNSAEKPGFAKILGRTFCRLIPFDAFSFFAAGARGWHDSIPNTYVVETVDIDDAADEITLDAELDMQKI